MTTIEEMKQDYDWKEAFGFAPFDMDEVATIISSDEGYNDGDSWVCVGQLKDGRYFFLTAWCDYTGWDCQASGDCSFALDLEALTRWNLGQADRKRLNMLIDEEK